ncbi:hypothetical protein NPIL_222481 [Nephila pilipes]|uniref:Uncharacterized protein n=1 Tax=Nephila pilipes TaxID=299642 RepID=A0A8X6NRM4_NEPPI|nr:hypothetical protein NPIL_222481 [Nephila pilipes]
MCSLKRIDKRLKEIGSFAVQGGLDDIKRMQHVVEAVVPAVVSDFLQNSRWLASKIVPTVWKYVLAHKTYPVRYIAFKG